MSYRTYRRSSRPVSRWLTVKYAGTCKVCGAAVPVGARAFYDAGARTLTCATLPCAKADGLTRSKWSGSPVSGQWCDTYAEYRIGEGAPIVHYGRGNTRRRSGYRCEDAPCCGCCD